MAQYRSENRAKLLSQRVASEQKRRLALNGIQSENVAAVIGEALAAYRIGNLYLDVYSGQLIAKPTVDHIIPISTGGKHEAENLCVASFENNRSKRATPLIVWMARRAAQCQST